MGSVCPSVGTTTPAPTPGLQEGDTSALRMSPLANRGSQPRTDASRGTLPPLLDWTRSGGRIQVQQPLQPEAEFFCFPGGLGPWWEGAWADGPTPHTHVINLWLRHRDPLVDSQGCVTYRHPLLLPAEDGEEPVTRGCLGQTLLTLTGGRGLIPLEHL